MTKSTITHNFAYMLGGQTGTKEEQAETTGNKGYPSLKTHLNFVCVKLSNKFVVADIL